MLVPPDRRTVAPADVRAGVQLLADGDGAIAAGPVGDRLAEDAVVVRPVAVDRPPRAVAQALDVHPDVDRTVVEPVGDLLAAHVTAGIELRLVPSLWPLLLRNPEFRWPELAHVEIGAFGGSPVPLSTIAALRERMPQLRLYDLYGLTETHSPATCLYDGEFRRKSGSVGRPLPCADVRVVDDSGCDVGAGEAGELWIRGPMVTSGYFADEEATAAAITDGWLHSGDLGYVDDDGFLYLVDRKKDMIISGGVNVYPRDIEEVVVQHPAVREVAVFGVADPKWGETPIAAVVLRQSGAVTREALTAWINARVGAKFQRVSDVMIVDDFPRNVAGKTLKRILQEHYKRL